MTQNDHSLLRTTSVCWLIFVIIAALYHFRSSLDYVGTDNDDVMRLVQIRDWLSGQNWFDLTQYRLGLDGGTLMHWSRLIDLPIACLIILFSVFLAPLQAEAVALFIWPLMTAAPVIYGFGRGGQILSPDGGAIVGAVGAIAFLFWTGKFLPGAIDHHNIQIAIIALLVPVIIDPSPNWRAYIYGGALSAFAITIGAETTPLIAIVCAIIALSWAWHGGKIWRRPTRLFALSFCLSLTLLFFATTPPHFYFFVACDTLSTAYYIMGICGAGLLFLAAAKLSYHSRGVRFSSLFGIAIIVFAITLLIAPQCLRSPLADLDPQVRDLWLDNVSEARSFLSLLSISATELPGFYLVPIFAMVYCLMNILSRDNYQRYLILFTMIATAFAISLVQVRGSIFANLFAMIALVGMVSHFRARSNKEPQNIRAAALFILSAFLSMPLIWSLIGVGISSMTEEKTGQTDQVGIKTINCVDEDAFRLFKEQPKGIVATASNLGAHLLRYTHHSTLSAPYHRNQAGLLAELEIGMASPDKALKLLNEADVSYIGFCATDAQVKVIIQKSPNGLYALLSKHEVPEYLQFVPSSENQAIEIYRVRSVQ